MTLSVRTYESDFILQSTVTAKCSWNDIFQSEKWHTFATASAFNAFAPSLQFANNSRQKWQVTETDLSKAVNNADSCRCPSTEHMTNEKVHTATLHIAALTNANCAQCSHQCYTSRQQDDHYRKSQSSISLFVTIHT